MSRRAAAVLAAIALAGCGGEDEPAPEPPGSGGNGSGFDKNAEQNAFRDSKDLCGVFSVKEVAREYGGDPDDPLFVAIAFAEQAYVDRFQAAAQDGCLEGFEGP